jgi:hypothetical protein
MNCTIPHAFHMPRQYSTATFPSPISLEPASSATGDELARLTATSMDDSLRKACIDGALSDRLHRHEPDPELMHTRMPDLNAQLVSKVLVLVNDSNALINESHNGHAA